MKFVCSGSVTLKSWKFPCYCQEDRGKGQLLDEKGRQKRDSQRPTGGFATHRKKTCSKIASGGQCVASLPCISHLPMLDARAGTARCNTQERMCCEMKAGARMEGGRSTGMGDSEGHLQEHNILGLQARDKMEGVVYGEE